MSSAFPVAGVRGQKICPAEKKKGTGIFSCRGTDGAIAKTYAENQAGILKWAVRLDLRAKGVPGTKGFL